MNDPMDLKDLPGYIQGGGDDVVVNMGKIVTKSNNWPRKVVFSSVVCLLFGVVAYSALSNNSVTLVIDSDMNPEVVSDMISKDGVEVVSVVDNSYKVRVGLRNVNSVIEKLRKLKDIKKVEIK